MTPIADVPLEATTKTVAETAMARKAVLFGPRVLSKARSDIDVVAIEDKPFGPRKHDAPFVCLLEPRKVTGVRLCSMLKEPSVGKAHFNRRK